MNDTIKTLNMRIKDIIHTTLSTKVKIIAHVVSIRKFQDHLYILLKDDFVEIQGVIWNASTKNIVIEESHKYEVYGTLDVYVKNCTVQLNIQHTISLGTQNPILELKTKLHNEGLFDKKKKPLPINITNIGILTSLDSASLTDILSVFVKNEYKHNVIVKHCIVQGKSCAESVVNGIKWFEDKLIDVLIITRGGGSNTDLSSYSDESLIRAIYDCKHCVISAIGHARDTVLCDDIADIKVTTPTNAGQLVSKKTIDIEHQKLETLYDIIMNKLNVKQYDVKKESFKNDVNNVKHDVIYALHELRNKTSLLSNTIVITNHEGLSITSLKQFNKYVNHGLTIHFADGSYEL